MARDVSLNPPPGTPVEHPYDAYGFRPSHFVTKQHDKLKTILNAHTLNFNLQRNGPATAWHAVSNRAMTALVKQHCLVHSINPRSQPYEETKALLLKTLLQVHLVIEGMPLYTFLNRVRVLPLAKLKEQCVALCKMVDLTTPATARFKPTIGGSED